ncbi:MAG TPA: hypothetical protein PLR18_00600 [bacterium]|nr:hypothetical protein [bacterium]
MIDKIRSLAGSASRATERFSQKALPILGAVFSALMEFGELAVVFSAILLKGIWQKKFWLVIWAGAFVLAGNYSAKWNTFGVLALALPILAKLLISAVRVERQKK